MEWVCDAVLFDMDGVLVDSTACVEWHWRQWAAEHGLDAQAILAIAHGQRTVETIRAVAPHLDADEEAAQLEARASIDTEGVVSIQGAARLVRNLPPDAWAIGTSAPPLMATTRLQHTGVLTPTVLITAEDVGQGKPHPQVYLEAAARLHVAPARCIVIEDAPAGIEAARAAGMRVLAVATTHEPAALQDADAVVMQLLDLEITPTTDHHDGRLVVRILLGEHEARQAAYNR
jgi:sugar-phosphatase